MKKRYQAILLLLFICFAVAAFALIRHGKSTNGTRTSVKTAEWESYEYREAGRAAVRDFNVRMRVTRTGAPFCLRLLLNVRDDRNYSFLEFAEDRTALGKVQDGLEFSIANKAESVAGRGEPVEILVKRRGPDIKVYAGQVLVLVAADGADSRGRILLGQTGEGASVESFRIQPVGDIFFSDDFMKAATEPSVWETVSGSWHVETLENPSLSANAFYFVGRSAGERAIATTGYRFWDNYSLQIACRPIDDRPLGLVVHYQGPDDYTLFRWASAADKTAKHRQLIRRRNGKETVLAEAGGGYTAQQWYRLRMTVRDDTVSAAVDGNTILEARDPLLFSGQVGLFTEGTETRFDDAYVVGERGFGDTFETPCPGRWQELGGTWRFVRNESGVRMRVNATGRAKAITGSSRWRDYTVSANLVEWQRGEVGLCAGYQDERNHLWMHWKPEAAKVVLSAIVNGENRTLDEQTWNGPASYPCRIEVGLADGLVRGSFEGGPPVASVAPGDLASGEAGLSGHGCDAGFDDVSVVFPKSREPVLTLNEVFAGESSMANWSSADSDWVAQRDESKEARARFLYWHQADLPGDGDIELDLAGRGSQTGEPEVMGLILCGDGQAAGSGYSLMLDQASPATLMLHREEELMSKAAVGSPSATMLKLSRRGGWVLGSVDGKVRLSFRDPDPLKGTRAAFATSASEFDSAHLEVFSPNLFTYNFQKAPAEWREAGGTWQIANRWKCDPRWSFFSGESRKVAAIWNKRRFEGDLTLEFSAAIKMGSSRGPGYKHAADINAAICADGRDLDTGYCFLFGGMDNTGTYVLRKNQIVAKAPSVIIRTTGIHRRWFSVRIRKQGGRLSLWIDRLLVAEYTDPAPLPGEHLALWTYNNGVMLTRVRISSESGRTMELPSPTFPAASRCFYDQ